MRFDVRTSAHFLPNRGIDFNERVECSCVFPLSESQTKRKRERERSEGEGDVACQCVILCH